MFTEGETYKRAELHKKYGGQRQGGISTPSQHKIIMLFTGASGTQYGYKDGWTKDDVFQYTGEGQVGDMRFVRGNLAIRDHLANGKDIHVFEQVKKGHVRYIGQMKCTGFQYRTGPDMLGRQRRIIVFELAPVATK